MIAFPQTVSNNIATTTATIARMIPISLIMGGGSNDKKNTSSSTIWYTPLLGTTATATTTTTTSVLAATRADNIIAIIGTNVSAHIPPAISHVLLAPKMTTSTLETLVAIAVPTTTMTSTTTTMLSEDLVASSVAMVYDTTAMANRSAGDAEQINSFYFFPAQLLIMWGLWFAIVFSNSAVLFVMSINKNRKSRMHFFIKQLAFADLCVGLVLVTTDIIEHTTIIWQAGNIGCKLVKYAQHCVTYSSTYVLVAMSIDRYDAITHPLNFSKSWKRARRLVAWAWGLSALFASSALVLFKETEVEGKTQCWNEMDSLSWKIYFSLVTALVFVLPAIIISACYAIIVKTIWSKGSIFMRTELSGYSNPATRRASSRGIIPRAKVKTVKMTLVIVIVFIVCWLPYTTFNLLHVYNFIEETQNNTAIATLIQSLVPLNSVANPIIYCVFSSQIFRTLRRFAPFKWFTCCCKSYHNSSLRHRCSTVQRRLHNSASDSMRTLNTSASKRSNKTATRVVICEDPKAKLPIIADV